MNTKKQFTKEILSDFFDFLEDFDSYYFALALIKYQYVYARAYSKIKKTCLAFLTLKIYENQKNLITSRRISVEELSQLIADFIGIESEVFSQFLTKISGISSRDEFVLLKPSSQESQLMFEMMEPFILQKFRFQLTKYRDQKQEFEKQRQEFEKKQQQLEEEKQMLLDFAEKWNIKFKIDHSPDLEKSDKELPSIQKLNASKDQKTGKKSKVSLGLFLNNELRLLRIRLSPVLSKGFLKISDEHGIIEQNSDFSIVI